MDALFSHAPATIDLPTAPSADLEAIEALVADSLSPVLNTPLKSSRQRRYSVDNGYLTPYLRRYEGNSPKRLLDWLIKHAQQQPLIVVHEQHFLVISHWRARENIIYLPQSKVLPILASSEVKWRHTGGLEPGIRELITVRKP